MAGSTAIAPASPHILFVLPALAGGGAERVTLTLLKGLTHLGVRAELVVFNSRGPLAAELGPDARVHDLDRPTLRAALPPLVRLLRKLRPDAVLSTLGYVNLGMLSVRSLLPGSTRLILREANLPSLSLGQVPMGGFLRLGYRLLYRRADLIFCSSRRMKDELTADFQVAPSRLAILPNPIDVERVRRRAKEPCRHPGEGIRLIASGRLTHQKGFDCLIEMFSDLPPSTHLTILGDGPEHGALTALIQNLGLAQRIILPGFVASPWAHYAGADAFLMPSRWEGMPNAALEALACGTPVIATPEAGGLAEVAAEAPAGAVRIAASGGEFLATMTRVTARPSSQLRDSLLPTRYHLPRVLSEFTSLVGWRNESAPVSR